MIGGTLILEDLTITFAQSAKAGEVAYTVCDNMTGSAETKVVSDEKFMSGICVAMRFSGEPLTEEEGKDAEEIQPNNPKLRFIP